MSTEEVIIFLDDFSIKHCPSEMFKKIKKRKLRSATIDIPAPDYVDVHDIPVDIWMEVINYLSCSDVVRLAISCKQFSVLLHGDGIWRRLLARDFPKFVVDESTDIRQQYIVWSS